MGKVVLITGASSGIGHEMAMQLGAQGFDLALVARREALLETLKQGLQAKGYRAMVVVADVSQRDSIRAAVEKVENEFGPIERVIANAGMTSQVPGKTFDSEAAQRVFEVNTIGAIHTIAAVVPHMIKRKRGQIVGISSLASYMALPKDYVYSASKVALAYYLDGLRYDVARRGLQVTVICPGFIRTPMTADGKIGDVERLPFLLEADDAVRRILRAVDAGKSRYNFPWPLYALVRTANFIPKFLLAKALKFVG